MSNVCAEMFTTIYYINGKSPNFDLKLGIGSGNFLSGNREREKGGGRDTETD
jgi:hypothetical protein